MDLLLMSNPLTLAEETFFMFFPHVHKHFIIAEEAFAAELAKGMRIAVNLVLLFPIRSRMPIVS